MPVFEIDPQQDTRWTSLVESHRHSSVFHSAQWLDALRTTYGYAPTVFTTSPPEAHLTNGIVFCRVGSWLTGSRLVSLPFSDHCEPLVDNAAALITLLAAIREKAITIFKYAEIRPRYGDLQGSCNLLPYSHYSFHWLDLHRSAEELYSGLHKNSIQRKIRRADREGVVVHQGRSELLLEQFYALLLLTRRRHHLPPQPLAWFRNLVACLGPRLTIRVARVDDRPIASILTLRHKQTLVYKYGCSDERFHNLGGMPRLFWQTIQEAKSEGLEELDLGRSDQSNPGLVQFKDHLGAASATLEYSRFSRYAVPTSRVNAALNSPWMQTILSNLPDRLFRLAGEIFYRHAA